MRRFRSEGSSAANYSPVPVNENHLSISKDQSTISTSNRNLKRSKAMAKKRKRRSSRKRDAKGHFVSAKRRTKRRKAPKSRTKRKYALGSRGRRGKRRRRVKTHTRKVGKRRVRVRSHLSHEEKPKRRRRRRARKVQEEATMPRRRRRRAKKAVTRRRRRRHVAENPVRRRRRRRHSAMANPRKRRRRRAKGRKLSTKALCRRPSRRRPRYVYTRRSKASKRRKSYARRPKKLTAGPEYIGAEYGLENPLSGGEMLLAGITGTLGYVLTDILDRFLANSELATTGSSSIASGQTAMDTPVAVLTKPGIWRVLAQAGAAAVPFVGAYWAKEPMLRAGLQGLGLGALIHLGGQVVEHYVIAMIAGGQPAPTGGTPSTGLLVTLNQLYAPEIVADNLSDQVTTGTAGTLTAINGAGTGILTPGTINGIPSRGIGRVLKTVSKGHQVPRALGACGDPPSGSGWSNSNTGDSDGCGSETPWTPPPPSSVTPPQPPSTSSGRGPADPSGDGGTPTPSPSPIWSGPVPYGGGNGTNPPSGIPPMNGGNYNPNGNPTPLAGLGTLPLNQMFPDD
jgi:hypothetical protein